MAKRQPPEPQSANLQPDQMRAALPRLRSRLEELRAVKIENVQKRGDPALVALEQKVNSTLSDILGPGSVDYQQFGDVRFDRAGRNSYRPTPLNEVRLGYERGIGLAIASIEALASLFEEKLGAGGEDSGNRARRAFGDHELHPELLRAIGKLFADGHYSNAVEDACKVLDLLVKLRSGRQDLSGTELMQAVFSPKNPVLRFNALQTESDRSEQQGMMYLYAGAMLALRNPRAHVVIRDESTEALEYIGLVNMLIRALDRAERI